MALFLVYGWIQTSSDLITTIQSTQIQKLCAERTLSLSMLAGTTFVCPFLVVLLVVLKYADITEPSVAEPPSVATVRKPLSD